MIPIPKKQQIKRMLAPAFRQLGFVPWSPAPRPVQPPSPPQEPGPLENCFGLLQRLGFKPSHIVDIGANHGEWTRKALRFFPDAHYTLLEPQAWLKVEVQDLLDKFPNIRWHNVGALDQDGVLKFTVRERDDSSSFRYSSDQAAQGGFKQIDVPVVRLDKLLLQSGLPIPNLIKIDAEGLDLSVLKGCGSLLGATEVFFIEAAVMDSIFPNDLLAVLQMMKQNGYRLLDFTDLNRTPTRGVLMLMEAVFVKVGTALDQSGLEAILRG